MDSVFPYDQNGSDDGKRCKDQHRAGSPWRTRPLLSTPGENRTVVARRSPPMLPDDKSAWRLLHGPCPSNRSGLRATDEGVVEPSLYQTAGKGTK